MVFAPIFKSDLHLSIQKEKNKVMLFKHVSIAHMGRTDHLLQAVTWPGFALSSRAAPALCSWCWFMAQSLQYLSADKGCWPPPQPSVTGWWGAFAREFTACVGSLAPPWEKWSLCQMCLLPHWSPRTSLLQGESPGLHAKHLILLWQTQHSPNSHGKFTLNFNAH